MGVTATAIAPLHGPVIASAKNELVREYRDWLDAQAGPGLTPNLSGYAPITIEPLKLSPS